MTARAGASSSSPAAITPPPMTTISGLKMFSTFATTTPSRSPISATASRAAVVAVVGELGDERAGERRVLAAAAPGPIPARIAPSRRASSTSAVPLQ